MKNRFEQKRQKMKEFIKELKVYFSEGFLPGEMLMAEDASIMADMFSAQHLDCPSLFNQ